MISATIWRGEMSNKFTKVPIEDDTRILHQKQGKLREYDVRYEIWSWDSCNSYQIYNLIQIQSGCTLCLLKVASDKMKLSLKTKNLIISKGLEIFSSDLYSSCPSPL